MAAAHSTRPAAAYWFFIVATFVFAVPSLIAPDLAAWVRAALLLLGLVLVVMGGRQFSAELRGRRRNAG